MAATEKLERQALAEAIEASAGIARGLAYAHWRDRASTAQWVRGKRRTDAPSIQVGMDRTSVILRSMTRRVGPKGQVVIPKSIRDQLGIAPGDEVVVVAGDDEVRIKRARGLRNLAGAFQGVGLRKELEAERRREREQENQRLTDLGHGPPE